MKLDKDVREAILVGAAIIGTAICASLLLTHIWMSLLPEFRPLHAYLLAIVMPMLIAPVGVTLILRSHVHVARLAKENYHLAFHDTLTGLPNRRAFFTRAAALQAGHDEAEGVFFCGIADIDNFKRVNDQFGHDTGDLVLKGIAEVIENLALQNGIVARLGGEEFSIVGRFAGEAQARLYAEALVRSVNAKTHACCNGKGHVTISLGYCLAMPGETLSSMLTRADAALYYAKRTGKNRAVASHEIPPPAVSVA